MNRILVVDDDNYIGDMLDEVLHKEGYFVTRAYSGTEALLAFHAERPDLVLLDLMLPGLNGEEVLPNMKGVPVIVMSAKNDVKGKVELLLGGAADYVTKPFEINELVARVKVQLRDSASVIQSSELFYKDLTLNLDTHTVTAKVIGKHENKGNGSEATICFGKYREETNETQGDDKRIDGNVGFEIRLTRTEFAILKILMQNPTQVITKTQLLDRIAEDTPDCTDSSLKMHVSNLRKKLREAAGREYIEAVWGIGFKLY